MTEPPRENAMRHILLVEDDHAHAELIRRAFEPQGQSIAMTIVHTLRVAYETVRVSTPDLIIADLRLPDGQGIELLSMDNFKEAFPVVIMTSYGDEHMAVEAIKAGALDYIVKSGISLNDMPRIAERALREWDHILERKRVEKELQQYREHLEELVAQRTEELTRAKEDAESAKIAAENANQAKSRFLSSMSHELRTPLNAILGFSSLMARDSNVSASQQEHLNIINRSGEHLLLLINDILEVSRIEAGRETLELCRFNFLGMLDTVEQMIRVRAEKKGLQFSVEYAPNLPRSITSDERKLHQILLNLLSNAVKFTEDGRITLRVNVRSSGVSEYQATKEKVTHSATPALLFFEVEDTGAGISSEALGHIFEPFFQTESGRQIQEGAGLGLAISRQFVDLMGGTLTVTSQVGQGSVFGFSMQIEPDHGGTLQQHSPRQIVGLAPEQPVYHILIVEDSKYNRLLLHQLLQSVGFEVRDAVNGQEALEVIEHWQPDLIWMDMSMPVMDGYEATRRIRKLEGRRQWAGGSGQGSENEDLQSTIRTPIIALTANAFEEHRERVLAAGCDDFVRKPFREAEVFEIMTKYLGVQYLYEESSAGRERPEFQKPLPASHVTVQQSLSSSIIALPPELLIKLEQATNRSDMELIVRLIAEVRSHDAVIADALAHLSNMFDYDEILRLLHEAREEIGRLS